MWELIAKPLFDAAVQLAKDMLKLRLDDINKVALDKKKAAARKKLPKDDLTKLQQELGRVSLNADETVTGDVDLPVSTASELLVSHVTNIQKWASAIGFADIRGTKSLHDIYIELDTYLTPTRLHLAKSERSQTIKLEQAIFQDRAHCVILGQPGAGKTTSMKRLCAMVLTRRDALSTKHIGNKYSFPLLIRFRDLNIQDGAKPTIINELKQIFPLQFHFSGPIELVGENGQGAEYKDQSFLHFIDALSPLIILDGFDEYPDDLGKPRLAAEIRKLALSLSKATMVITCRTGEFNYNLENARTFEIATLNRTQVEEFVNRWITSKNEANQFIAALYDSPFADTAIKPLSLAHLCAIYERIGKIPDRPKTVYRKIVALLLEEWDQQRAIRRQSKYAKFEADRKFEFLSHLAFDLTIKTRRSVFSKNDFVDSYKRIFENFGLEETEANLVALEIESHTGLFLQSGYDQYEFAHKSIQEYLAAEYIVKLPSIPRDIQIMQALGAELAIAVAISSNPSAYMSDLVLNAISREDLPPPFYDAFINRLVLEKPDFYQDVTVILAFFTLLTGWINRGKLSATKNAPREITLDDEARYKNLLSLISAQNPTGTIAKYYDIINPALEPRLYYVRRRRLINGFKLPTYLIVPTGIIRDHLPDWPHKSQ